MLLVLRSRQPPRSARTACERPGWAERSQGRIDRWLPFVRHLLSPVSATCCTQACVRRFQFVGTRSVSSSNQLITT